MSRNIRLLFFVIAAVIAGVLIGRISIEQVDKEADMSAAREREVLYWVAPMDPKYRRDDPGKSPMGMDLVPVYADEIDNQSGVVKIDPTVVNNLGVRTAAAAFGELSRRIETVGYISYDEDTVQHVHTRVDGWIERLATKSTGDRVEKGQLLFELYAPTLVNAQQEYLAALRSGNTVLRKASSDRLTALGVTASEISRLDKERSVKQRVRVYAEEDGVIAHLGAREGIFVTPSDEVMSIAKLDRVWVIAEVFERQVAWVKPGQQSEVELDYLPGEKFRGAVDYVYPELDPKTRTLKVRLRFENSSESLRPNMFARVTIHGDSTGNVVHVPKQALIRSADNDRVVVDLGEGRFQARKVTVGIESADRVAILNGVSKGEDVVVSAQFLIDSESHVETALNRMESRPDEDDEANREPEEMESMK